VVASVRIRAFQPGDLEEVVEVWEGARRVAFPWLAGEGGYSHDDNLEYFRDEVCRGCALWVAVAGGRVVGMMALAGRSLDHLYVAPDRQGEGVGEALLVQAKTLSPGGLTLSTFERAAPARRFYERRGFVLTGMGTSPPPEEEPRVDYAWGPGGG
jgi:GNAT superfamily N-acetyltransferase